MRNKTIQAKRISDAEIIAALEAREACADAAEAQLNAAPFETDAEKLAAFVAFRSAMAACPENPVVVLPYPAKVILKKLQSMIDRDILENASAWPGYARLKQRPDT